MVPTGTGLQPANITTFSPESNTNVREEPDDAGDETSSKGMKNVCV